MKEAKVIKIGPLLEHLMQMRRNLIALLCEVNKILGIENKCTCKHE